MAELHLAPNEIFEIGGFPVTNSLILSVTVSVFLITVAFVATRRLKDVPSGLQNFLESIVEFGYNFTKDISHQKTNTIFPLIATFFVFIIISNWMGMLPGIGTVGFFREGRFEPLFRGATSDLNITFGLGIISMAAIHYYAVRYLGIGGYLKRWFSLNPIFLFVGFLEIVSEITKMFSLSFRLFGNIFAGEVVLATITNLFAFLAPVPFYIMETIVGFVQATVFAMLTLVFLIILSNKAHH